MEGGREGEKDYNMIYLVQEPQNAMTQSCGLRAEQCSDWPRQGAICLLSVQFTFTQERRAGGLVVGWWPRPAHQAVSQANYYYCMKEGGGQIKGATKSSFQAQLFL